MPVLDEISAWLNMRLPELVAKHEVTGASVAVLYGGEVVDAAAGSANLRAGIDATPETLFQIGSITKIWTTTLVMRLVDEGLVKLDEAVTTYLPEFRTADPEASARITIRQLLSHTSGFEGDVFKDTGRGDDAVKRFVDEIMPTVPQTLPPGRLFSYNNAGFVVLGRIVEVLRGTTWANAIHEEIAGPLGITVATNADEAILHRAAVGHVSPEPSEPLDVMKVWGLPASNGPAGAMLSTSARDLLGFARMHLDGGLAPDGTRLLSAESVAAMRVPQVDVPRRTTRHVQLGLGWHLFDYAGAQTIGHDGNTIGQTASLRIIPDKGLAIALLTNGGDPIKLYRDVLDHILAELAGMSLPDMLGRPEQPAEIADPARYTGVYESGLYQYEVSTQDGRLWMDSTPNSDLPELGSPTRRELLGFGDDLFAAVDTEKDGDIGMAIRFIMDGDGDRATFLHNHRANPRVA